MIPARLAAFMESCLLGQGRALVAWLPVAWAIGSLLYFLPLHEPGYGRASLCGFSGLMLLIFGWRRLTTRGLGFVVLLVSLGFLAARGQAWRQPPMPALPSIAMTMHGVIADVSSHGEEGHVVQRLRLSQAVFETGVDIGMAPLRRDLLLFTHDEQNYAPGMVVRLNAVLRPPDWPDFPGGRDRQREGWFDGLAGTGRVLGVPDIVQAPQGHALGRWRLHIAAVIATHLSGQRAAIASTLLAGHGEGISQKTRDAYAASGLAHILAVAGLHLGLVMGAVFFMTRQALVLWPWLGLRLPCREIAALTALASGLIYVALTGFHLPALRSLGMAGLATLALLTGRRVLSMRSLALVALVLLMACPVLVLDLSFQMSFAAVMALIAGYEALRPHFVRRAEQGKKNGLGHHLALLSLTSVLAGGGDAASGHGGIWQFSALVHSGQSRCRAGCGILCHACGASCLAADAVRSVRAAALGHGAGNRAYFVAGCMRGLFPAGPCACPAYGLGRLGALYGRVGRVLSLAWACALRVSAPSDAWRGVACAGRMPSGTGVSRCGCNRFSARRSLGCGAP
ncbi:ComEC/Rec2 family competence protein [Asaia spathodeae]